jgi:hypothetical protein
MKQEDRQFFENVVFGCVIILILVLVTISVLPK